MRAYCDQHFLSDTGAVNKIAGLLEVSGSSVLEIGPGGGVLTRALLDQGAIVTAIEIDSSLIPNLSCIFFKEIEDGRLVLINGDAVKINLPKSHFVVANLPYSVSSPIMFRLFETGFEAAVLMFQKEFADRMMADIGTRDCGRLTIMVQTYARISRVFDLPPSSFSPPPEVNSTVVWIEPREPIFPISDDIIYEKVVRILYSRRRKTVRSILKGASGEFGKVVIDKLLSLLDEEILNARPEALYLEDYATITNYIAGR